MIRKKSTLLILYLIATLVALIFLAPFVWIIFTSLKPSKEVFSYPITLFPRSITLEHYEYVIFKMSDFRRYFWNSTIITGVSLAIIAISSSLGGYALGRKNFWGKNWFIAFILLVLAIPYSVYLIPIFIMEPRLGIKNSYLALILPYVALNLPWGLFIMMGTFRGVPSEIEDAARIDGCSEYQLWSKIMLPLAKPGLATTIIITFIFIWQEFIYAVTLQTDARWKTLPVGIVHIRDELQSLAYDNLSVAIILSLLPLFIVFVALKDFFIKGIVEGGLKG